VNISYKREVVEQVGLQDETLFRGEDVDYNWRVQQLGYKIWYDPAIRVYHYHRPTLRSFFHQHYMYGRAYYLVREKWPEMYCVYPHTLHRWVDWRKLAYFFLGVLIEPFVSCRKLSCWSDRLVAYPLLVANHIAWRCGMVRQKLASHA